MLLQAGWNLSFISSRVSDMSEVSVVDTALHGTLGLWSSILPPQTRWIADLYSYAARSGHCRLIASVCRTFGIGLVQIRLPQLIAGCAALWLLAWLTIDQRMPFLVSMGLLGYGFSFFFYRTIVSAREEAFVLLAICLNAAWLLRPRSRLFSVFCGCAAMAAFAFHPNAIFLEVALPACFLFHYRRQMEQYAFPGLWWLVGASIGIQYVLHVMDWDRALLYFLVPHFSLGFTTIPPIVRFFRDPIHLFFYPFAAMGSPEACVNPWQRDMVGCLVAGIVSQLRRYSKLSEPARALLLLGGTIFIVWATVSCSPTHFYQIYFLPFFLIQTLLFVHETWSGRFQIDAYDWILLVFAQVLLHQAYLPTSEMGVASLLAIGLLPGVLFLSARPLILLSGLLLTSLVCNPEFLVIMPHTLRYLFSYRPWYAVGITLSTCFFLLANRYPRIILPKNFRAMTRFSFGALIVSVLFANAITDLKVFRQTAQEAHFSSHDLQRLALLRHEQRLIGPMALYVYEPTIAFQAHEALFHSQALYNLRFDYVVKSMARFRPSMILLPSASWPDLQIVMAQNPGLVKQWSREPVLDCPLGSFVPVRIAFDRDALRTWSRDFGVIRAQKVKYDRSNR